MYKALPAFQAKPSVHHEQLMGSGECGTTRAITYGAAISHCPACAVLGRRSPRGCAGLVQWGDIPMRVYLGCYVRAVV